MQFKRKHTIVSKNLEIVNLTVALFARFRVNGDVSEILKIGQAEPNIIIYAKTLLTVRIPDESTPGPEEMHNTSKRRG